VIPLHLSLRNCRTYETLDLELPEGALAICGLNGSGKSTLVNAVDVALFGPDSRTLADWLSEDQPEGTLSITLTFQQENDIYRVRRTFNGKGRGQSNTDLERNVIMPADGTHDEGPVWEPLTLESQSATHKLIEQITGLNRATFRASSFIAQSVMFCDLQPREQKRILGKLLQLGQWDAWRDRAAAERRATESELDRLAGSLERAEQEIADRPEIEKALASAQERERETRTLLDAALARLATAREALAEARRRVEVRAAAEKGLQQAEQMLAEATKSVEACEDSIRALDARLSARSSLETIAGSLEPSEAERESLRVTLLQWDERERLIQERDAAMSEHLALAARANNLLEQESRVLASPGQSCDRCGQELHDDAAERAANSYRNEATEVTEGAMVLADRGETLAIAVEELPADQPDRERMAVLNDQIQRAQNARTQIAALDEAMQLRDDLHDEVRQMRAGLPEREAAVGTARAELNALGPHNPEVIADLQAEIMQLADQEDERRYALTQCIGIIARADERLERLDKIAADLTQASARRDTLHTSLDLYTRMERACGPNGVPALILEQMAIPQIETEADEILRRFGSKAIGVQLLTQREKKDEGLTDTLQVNVLTEYGSRAYSTFSTGEQLRINAAITLAIAQLLAARSAQTGLLVIDDLGPLDAQGMAVLAEICQELQQTVGRVFIISQSPELRDAFETSITIESVDGKSRIVNGTTSEPTPTIERTAV
jgi:exonuclease SbcC